MFNQDLFKTLLLKCIGTRTVTEFTNECNVNRTYISKYINNKLQRPPAPDIIKRIAENSHNGVTYEELMYACGYINNARNDTFIKENISLIRGNMTYEEMSKDISIKFNTPEYMKLFSAEYIKNIETGKISPTFQRINLLALYAEVPEEFFYKFNTQADLLKTKEDNKILMSSQHGVKLNRLLEELTDAMDPNIISSFFNMILDKNLDNEIKHFILCSDNIKYFEFAKRLKEKGINPEDITGFSLKY